MVGFAESLIFIVSIIGIFCILLFLTDEDYLNEAKNDNKSKVLDIYTYNIEEENINEIIKIIEKSKKLQEMVDIVNIHERFDKK